MLDALIRGGLVLDGSGSPGRVADVCIAGGRIVSVGRADPASRAGRVIDGDGLVVAPGFIDMHSHADYTLPAYPDALSVNGSRRRSAPACLAGPTTSRPVATGRPSSRAVVDPSLRHLEGQPIDEAAARAGVDPLDLVFDTLVADHGSTTMIMFLIDAADVDLAVAHPSSAIGSDQFGVVSPTARVHPRAYGAFVRVLAGAVRERGVLDAATVTARATFQEPTLLPVGVEAVLVGGRVAMFRGEAIDARLGRVQRRGHASALPD
ncbi:MAG: hypothetical protein LH650_07105 [Chloroflexi bacterium]|nr:hypothetical protein [Chloroflexota bacterium]